MNSLRFEELNKKCKKIKIKKILKVLIPLFLILIICVLSFLYYSKADNKSNISKKTLTYKTKNISMTKEDKNSTKAKVVHKNKITKPKLPKKNSEVIPKIKKEDKGKDDKILLNPALEIPELNSSKIIKKEIKVSTLKKRVVKPKAKRVEKTQIDKKPFKISVKNVDKESVLIKNYKNLKDYRSALKLATFYFDKKDYKKCIYWAKIASQLGKTADKPWILYAKAKYNLNQKEDAIKSLQMYLNYFDSKDVYELLRKFKKERKR